MARSQTEKPTKPLEQLLKEANQPQAEPDKTLDLAWLATLPKDELLALCERMARQCGLVANMTEEQTAQAMLDRLAHMALTAPVRDAIGAINGWLDRTQGRPTQRIEQKTLVAVMDMEKHREEVRAKALANMQRLAGASISSGGMKSTNSEVEKPL